MYAAGESARNKKKPPLSAFELVTRLGEKPGFLQGVSSCARYPRTHYSSYFPLKQYRPATRTLTKKNTSATAKLLCAEYSPEMVDCAPSSFQWEHLSSQIESTLIEGRMSGELRTRAPRRVGAKLAKVVKVATVSKKRAPFLTTKCYCVLGVSRLWMA